MKTFYQDALRRHYNHANHKIAIFMDYIYVDNNSNPIKGYIHKKCLGYNVSDLPKNNNAILARNKNDLKYNSSYDWLIPVYDRIKTVRGYSDLILKLADNHLNTWYNNAILAIDNLNDDIEFEIRFLLSRHKAYLSGNIYCIKKEDKYIVYCLEEDYDKINQYINSTELKDILTTTTDISFLESFKYDIIMTY